MTNLANAFGSKFMEQKDSLRIRSFKFGGHTFKVKVPLTVETEAMFERAKVVDEDKAEKYYQDMAKEFLDNRAKYENDPEVKYLENDVLIKDRSIRETTRNKVLTENRLVEAFKMLVPENKDFDMNTITYADIEELFPFSVQLELLDYINSTISPNYTATKGK